MGKPEGAVENYFKSSTEQEGFLCWKFKVLSVAGVPDRILLGHGRVLFVELKAPGETPRRLQLERIREMRQHGAIVDIIDTKPGVDEYLQRLKNEGIIPERKENEQTQ